MNKKLLVIGYVWPEPNSSAAGSRIIQLLGFFQQQGYNITFVSPAQTTDHMANLAELNIQCQSIALNCTSFDDFISELQPDIVLFDRFMMEEQFGWRVSKQCPQALRILDTEDLFCVRHARHNAHKQNRDMDTAELLDSELAKREVAAIFRCDLSIMISQVEMALLTDLFGVDKRLLHYCPFMFSDDYLQQQTPAYEQRDHFISIGNFRHPPNWDAVLWLKQQIWPLIRKQLPKAQLHIYGAYPPPKATALHDEKSGFLVKGWAEDALTVMKSAKICLAPLRFGAGIKGKLAEAMVCGTPSVTTDIGAESMQTQQTWGGAIANDNQMIAEQAVKLFIDESLWQEASDLGVSNAQLMYQENEHKRNLAETLNNLLDNLTQHRQQNFIGSMLNHHHQQSTRYMSQWIEVKNKLAATLN